MEILVFLSIEKTKYYCKLYNNKFQVSFLYHFAISQASEKYITQHNSIANVTKQYKSSALEGDSVRTFEGVISSV
jgi:hypothetical protein